MVAIIGYIALARGCIESIMDSPSLVCVFAKVIFVTMNASDIFGFFVDSRTYFLVSKLLFNELTI